MGSSSAAQRKRTSTARSRRGRHRASSERRWQTYPWLGASAVGLGIGAAALTGAGVAQAETKSSESSSEGQSSPTDRLSDDPAGESTADNGDGSGESTKTSPKPNPTASDPASSTAAADGSDVSAESEPDKADESDALDAESTERGSTTVATAAATERRDSDSDTSTTLARSPEPSPTLAQATAEQDESGSDDSPTVEVETPPGVVKLESSEDSTEELPQPVVSAAAADEPESQGEAWLQRKFFNKRPTVSFASGTTSTLPDGSIRGAVQGDDVDGDVLIYTADSPANGGTVAIDSSDGTFIYTPPAGSTPDGTDTFSVTVSDDAEENGPHTHGLLGLLNPSWGSTATTTVSIASANVVIPEPSNPTTPTNPTNPVPTGVPGSWNLRFQDEFTGTTLDQTKWSNCWFSPTCGAMNNVSTSPSNVAVKDGNLALTLSNSSTGALVSTNPHYGGPSVGYTFTTGVVEARIWFPGNGSRLYNWPAFWSSGQVWPRNGENDIAEVLGGDMTVNYHSASGAHNQGAVPGYWGGGFHTYTLVRKANSSDVYYDGVRVKSYSTDDGASPQYLIIGVGNGGGASAYGAASQVRVDYVRAWQ